MTDAYIVDAIRTPIGALGGSLAGVRPDDLAALVLAALVERNQLDPARIDEVILGCANQAGEDNRNIARMSTLLAGLPVDVPAHTVNRLCASGLEAVTQAARAIRAGDGDCYLAGGVEGMSRAPYVLGKAEQAYAFGNQTMYDTAMGWRFTNQRLTESHGTDPMGITAENIAEKYRITREEQDAFACASHQRAIAAQDAGKTAREILPVDVAGKKGDTTQVSRDERPRRDTTIESLARLKPAFKKDGTVTAGNASGLNDGAAGLALMSESSLKKHGTKPLARVVSTAVVGLEPRLMGLGPIAATQKALARAGLSIGQIGLAEINEAFAVQALACMRELGLSHEITNVNGGAVALGHPLGCSGARILVTLLNEMSARAASMPRPFYGLATLCVGVGQGQAMIVEWLG
jgi:3-oxoadipyl-CoA thiolase